MAEQYVSGFYDKLNCSQGYSITFTSSCFFVGCRCGWIFMQSCVWVFGWWIEKARTLSDRAKSRCIKDLGATTHNQRKQQPMTRGQEDQIEPSFFFPTSQGTTT